MRFLVIFITCLFIQSYANATQMCATSDTVAVILDPYIFPTSWTGNSTTKDWTATFSWGKASGVSACLPNNYGTTSTITINGVVVTGGEYTGRYCHCKMTHPAVSKWVMVKTFSDNSGCFNNCYNNTCGRFGYNGTDLSAIKAVFGSI